jgi:hypothetical protein
MVRSSRLGALKRLFFKQIYQMYEVKFTKTLKNTRFVLS